MIIKLSYLFIRLLYYGFVMKILRLIVGLLCKILRCDLGHEKYFKDWFMYLVLGYDLELDCVIKMLLALLSYWLSSCDDITSLV